MAAVNPKYVLRNYLAQLAIDKADTGSYDMIDELLDLLSLLLEVRAGRSSGQVTVRKTRAFEARRVCAASSSVGLIAAIAPDRIMKAIGVNDSTCAIVTSGRP